MIPLSSMIIVPYYHELSSHDMKFVLKYVAITFDFFNDIEW